MAKRKDDPTVFAVHKSETSDGRYHEVSWAKNGDLNAAARAFVRGKKNTVKRGTRRFRLWGAAKVFAKKQAKVMGTVAIFS